MSRKDCDPPGPFRLDLALSGLREVRAEFGRWPVLEKRLEPALENHDPAESNTAAGSAQDLLESDRERPERVDMVAHLAREVRPAVSLGLRPDGRVCPGPVRFAGGHRVVYPDQSLHMCQPRASVIVVARRIPRVRMKPAQQAFETGDMSLDLGEDGG